MLSRLFGTVTLLGLAAGFAPVQAQVRDTTRHPIGHRHGADSAFAALQARGQLFMGVDQYTSVHRFDSLPDGGRIELQRAVDDSAGVAVIRAHLAEIAEAFRNGDFSTPFGVHARDVPGTDVMAERLDRITYAVAPLPRGAEVRITTADSAALAAIHAFMAFQRSDHRAGGHHHQP